MTEILQQALWILFCIGTATAIIIGALAVVSPRHVIALNAGLGRSYRVPAVGRAADKTYRIERLFYRHHRIFGALLIIVPLFFFYTLWARFGFAPTTRMLGAAIGSGIIAEVLLMTAVVLLSLGNGVALVLGAVVLVRPSLLKSIEGWANRWITIEGSVEQLNRRRGNVDAAFLRWPRAIGLIVLLGGVYMAWGAWRYAF